MLVALGKESGKMGVGGGAMMGGGDVGGGVIKELKTNTNSGTAEKKQCHTQLTTTDVSSSFERTVDLWPRPGVCLWVWPPNFFFN